MPADLTITVPNRPGSLAEMTQHLADAGIEISSVVCDAGGVEADLHLLVDDVEAAQEALASAGVAIMSVQEVIVVDVDDRPDVLADIASQVAAAGVNIDLVYVATGTRVVLGSADMEALAEAVA